MIAMYKRIISATVITAFAVNQVYADDGLKMELTANKVVIKDNGSVDYTPVRNAATGTVIQYKAIYTNTTSQDINDLAVSLPIPTNMIFSGEAMPTSAQASIDGRNYADMPLMRRIGGKMVKVPFSEYKSLRWHIKLLPAKKSATVALNTIVD